MDAAALTTDGLGSVGPDGTSAAEAIEEPYPVTSAAAAAAAPTDVEFWSALSRG